MAIIACDCSRGGGNTGLPACFGVFDVTQNAIFVEYFKDDGTTINGIDISALSEGVLDQTFLDSKTLTDKKIKQIFGRPKKVSTWPKKDFSFLENDQRSHALERIFGKRKRRPKRD